MKAHILKFIVGLLVIIAGLTLAAYSFKISQDETVGWLGFLLFTIGGLFIALGTILSGYAVACIDQHVTSKREDKP